MSDSKFRSRKWILSMGIQIFTSFALAMSYIQGDVYATVTSANIAAYSFANAANYFAARDKTDV